MSKSLEKYFNKEKFLNVAVFLLHVIYYEFKTKVYTTLLTEKQNKSIPT